jgi:hypothetical protein
MTADERPAVAQAEQAADAWQAAVGGQRYSTADHSDFYALAAAMVSTLHSLDDIAGVLRRQVSGYARRPDLYDDTRQIDPADRLMQACNELTVVRTALVTAAGAANRFWSAVGHIGIEAQR